MHATDRNKILANDIGEFTHDPLGFVLYAFPWGSGELKEFDGPQPWQREELDAIGAALQSGESLSSAIRRAVASGHGIGKSALVSWVILWAMATCPDTRGVVTANTESQLKGKTWAELAKWHRLCICAAWFDCTATALISKIPGHEKTWRCDMVPWSERNTEAFAGLHNKGRRVLMLFDEASAIPASVWEVANGALTDEDTEILWLVYGNPTLNTGTFYECFNRFRHRWSTKQIDSRNVSITNKDEIANWINDYGEDSDFVRVRVRGIFPRTGSSQLIGHDLVERARLAEPDTDKNSPLIMGVDVARFGEDKSVIIYRQGNRSFGLKRFRGLDLMTYAGIIAEEIDTHKPKWVFVDQGGIGAGVVDRLKQLQKSNVIGVDFGGKPDAPDRYFNKRAEMWGRMRDWLKGDVSIPDDNELMTDLTGPQYGFSGDKGQIVLEKKADMKRRGLSSPDDGDALALTFAGRTNRLTIHPNFFGKKPS